MVLIALIVGGHASALESPTSEQGIPTEQGLASWYGVKFEGRPTASGETFDMGRLSAAHKALPFGTLAKVTNLENGLFTIVRINDRGPFVPGRIIDLSRAAAEEIGMLGKGVAMVKIEVVVPAVQRERFSIQVGAYSQRANYEKVALRLQQNGLDILLEHTERVTRVIVPDVTGESLEAIMHKLSGLGFSAALIRKHNHRQSRFVTDFLGSTSP